MEGVSSGDDALLPDHLVPEDDQPQVVDVLAIVLLDVDPAQGGDGSDDQGSDVDCSGLPVHVHQDVADHHHRCLVVVPRGVQGLE